MKKIISALAVFVMMLCLVACTNTNPQNPPHVDPPEEGKDPGVTNTFEYKVLICAPNSPALGDIVNSIYEKKTYLKNLVKSIK